MFNILKQKSAKNFAILFNILKQESSKNLAIIFFLGFSSGLPLVLTGSTLKLLLQDQGYTLSTIGFFSLVGMPYTLKFLFAPIIDSFKIPFLSNVLGQRRSWIMSTQLLIALFIALVGISALSGNILLIATFAILLAFLSASQDIVIDGYRIELIKKEEQGFAAGFYVYGYHIGMLISGAGALYLADKINWLAVYFILALVMLCTTFITILAKETRENFQSKGQNFITWFKIYVIEPFVNFMQHRRWYLILLFIILFKLGDAFAGNLSILFLSDLGFSKIQLASAVKTFGLLATLLGIFMGGVLVKKTTMIKALWVAGILQMISNLCFVYLDGIGPNIMALYAVIFAENLSGGIGTAVFIAYLSGLCNISFSTTQYALLSSFAATGRTFLSSTAGVFADAWGWHDFFILSTVVALPGLMILYLLTEGAKKD